MRPLKFRVWDERRKGWLQFDRDIPCDVRMTVGDNLNILELTPPGFVVEQFTGLLDMDGKEIYEGDILHDGGVVAWYNKLTWDGGCPHPGFYCASWTWERSDDGELELSYHDHFDGVKVIGNIHNNPELVKEQ